MDLGVVVLGVVIGGVILFVLGIAVSYFAAIILIGVTRIDTYPSDQDYEREIK